MFNTFALYLKKNKQQNIEMVVLKSEGVPNDKSYLLAARTQ